jgi:hypothetical protein
MSNWQVYDHRSSLEQSPLLPRRELGRPLARLARGPLWAALAIFIISILAFAAGRLLIPEPRGF